MASKLVNDTEMELYKRNFEIKKAAYDMEVETARAQAELAFQLQVIYFVTFKECYVWASLCSEPPPLQTCKNIKQDLGQKGGVGV